MVRRRLHKRISLAKDKAVVRLKKNRNIVSGFVEHYLLNPLMSRGMPNDPGASFTRVSRSGKYITKTARPRGNAKLRDEIAWLIRFSKTPFAQHLPRIRSYALRARISRITMQYYTYPNLRTIILERSNAVFFIRLRLQAIVRALRKYVYLREGAMPTPSDYVRKAHLEKYESRMRQAIRMVPGLRGIFLANHLTINNVRCVHPARIIAEISRRADVLRTLSPPRLYDIHGDLHANNILCGVLPRQFVLLDPRGRSPYGTVQCDVAYDIAKLYHDFHSYYSLIEKHRYSLFVREGRELNISFSITDTESKGVFDELLPGLRTLLRKELSVREFGNWEYRAQFIEALLFLTMLPFHLRDESEAVACYVTGVLLLNQWMRKHHAVLYREIRRN